MIPAVPLPEGSPVRTPIDVRLKRTWRFHQSRRVFESTTGETFAPRRELPPRSRIVCKVPALADKDDAQLSKHEKELRRHVLVILPKGESPAAWVETVRAWPPVEDAQVAPDVSLPSPG